jgi:hypothetical protein
MNEQKYRDALIGIWQRLGNFCPNDFHDVGALKKVEDAYYLAENALFDTKVLTLGNGNLRLSQTAGDARE